MMKRRSERRRGFTLIELLVVIAIIALLLAILVPSLSQAKAIAKKVPCMANLRGMGSAVVTYTTTYNEWVPPTFALHRHPGIGHPGGWSDLRWWADVIAPFFDTDAKNPPPYAYGYSIGVQPADGDYNKLATSKGVVFSQRMRCPGRVPRDDYQFYHNMAYWGFPCGWKMNCTGQPSSATAMGGWGFEDSSANPGRPRAAHFKNPSAFAFILEYDGVSLRDANYYPMAPTGGVWPHTNLVWPASRQALFMSASHTKTSNAAMLDGSVKTWDREYYLTQGMVNDFPFFVPP